MPTAVNPKAPEGRGTRDLMCVAALHGRPAGGGARRLGRASLSGHRRVGRRQPSRRPPPPASTCVVRTPASSPARIYRSTAARTWACCKFERRTTDSAERTADAWSLEWSSASSVGMRAIRVTLFDFRSTSHWRRRCDLLSSVAVRSRRRGPCPRAPTGLRGAMSRAGRAPVRR